MGEDSLKNITGVRQLFASNRINMLIEEGAGGFAIVSWRHIEGADKYSLYRSTTNKESDMELIWSGTSTEYLDNKNLVSGTTYYYRLEASDLSGMYEVFSSIENYVYKGTAPVITAQPKSLTVQPGTVYFTVTASGTGLKYQWEYRKTSSSGRLNVFSGRNC